MSWFSFSKQARPGAELICTHAEEGDLAPPEADQFDPKKNHFLLHRERAGRDRRRRSLSGRQP